jgi:NAD(P)-dependent dehydrogenase (short-subunit alcohol dehydrogenase family)
MALVAALLPQLRLRAGQVLNISSDAAVEAYETWGGYGSAKAALDQASRVLGTEEPLLRVYAVDPGDMRTALHQAAFPGEDIGDRPEPETVVPALLDLVAGDLPSGRYRAADLRRVSA